MDVSFVGVFAGRVENVYLDNCSNCYQLQGNLFEEGNDDRCFFFVVVSNCRGNCLTFNDAFTVWGGSFSSGVIAIHLCSWKELDG